MKNVTKQLLRGLALSSALIPAILPLMSHAESVAPESDFTARFTDVYGSQYPYEGTLQLRIGADGIITGYYRPSDNYDFVPVHGGRDGSRVWFDIGQDTHVDATLKDGKMTGSAIGAGSVPETFSASQR